MGGAGDGGEVVVVIFVSIKEPVGANLFHLVRASSKGIPALVEALDSWRLFTDPLNPDSEVGARAVRVATSVGVNPNDLSGVSVPDGGAGVAAQGVHVVVADAISVEAEDRARLYSLWHACRVADDGNRVIDRRVLGRQLARSEDGARVSSQANYGDVQTAEPILNKVDHVEFNFGPQVAVSIHLEVKVDVHPLGDFLGGNGILGAISSRDNPIAGVGIKAVSGAEKKIRGDQSSSTPPNIVDVARVVVVVG